MDVRENAARRWQQAECPHCEDDHPAKVDKQCGENGRKWAKMGKNWGIPAKMGKK